MSRSIAARTVGPVFIVLLVPLIQIGASPSWIFTPDGFDQWFYHGYFLHLKHHVPAFDAFYFGTRLAWILPGYLAHSFFSPLVANVLLRLFVYWMAALSTFFLLRRSYGSRCALISTLLLCSCADLLSAVGWDYVDGAGIAYTLLCLEELGAAAFAIRHARRVAMCRAGFAGVAFGAAIHSNIFLLYLVPLLALLTLARTGKKGLLMIFPAAAGLAVVTGALGLVSLSLGAHFLFFAPSLSAAVGLLNHNPYYARPQQWVGEAWWLVLPAALSVVSIACFLRPGKILRPAVSFANDSGPDSAGRLVDALSLPLAVMMFVILTAHGSSVLQVSYYASYLTIFLPITTGSLIGSRLEAWRRGHFRPLAAGVILLAVLVGAGVASRLPSSLAIAYSAVCAAPKLSAPALAAAFATAVIAAMYIRHRAASNFVLFISVGILLLHLGYLRLRESVSPDVSRGLYLDVDRISRELGRLSRDGPLWLWYAYKPKGDQHYTSIASTYLWAATLLGRSMPDSADVHFDGLHRGGYVALMDDRESAIVKAISVLRQRGVILTPVAHLQSTVRATGFGVSLCQVARLEIPPRAYRTAPLTAALAPATQILEYDTAQLILHTDHAFYGRPRPEQERALPPGVFRITDVKDHFGTKFQTLAALQGGPITAVEVTVAEQTGPEQFGSLNMILQDQGYHTLYWSGTLPNRRDRTMVSLPPGTQAIRLAFLANDDGYIRFPDFVRLEGFRPK